MKTYIVGTTTIQYILEQFENLNSRLDSMSQDISNIDSKIDILINNFVIRVLSIKKENRGVEEKIILIEDNVGNLLKEDPDYEYHSEGFKKIVSKKIRNWNLIHSDTKTFLVSAEYLYSSLQKIDNTDFSPCIIQFSKAFENELFIRLFEPFINYMKNNSNLSEILFYDLSKKETRIFAQQVISGSINRQLALGQMLYIIKNCGSPRKSSFLMKGYLDFLTNSNSKPSMRDLQEFEKINIDYRRKSAHPEVMIIKKAEEIKKLVPIAIDKLFFN